MAGKLAKPVVIASFIGTCVAGSILIKYIIQFTNYLGYVKSKPSRK